MIALIAAIVSLNVAAYETKLDFNVLSSLANMWVCGVSIKEARENKFSGNLELVKAR